MDNKFWKNFSNYRLLNGFIVNAGCLKLFASLPNADKSFQALNFNFLVLLKELKEANL